MKSKEYDYRSNGMPHKKKSSSGSKKRSSSRRRPAVANTWADNGQIRGYDHQDNPTSMVDSKVVTSQAFKPSPLAEYANPVNDSKSSNDGRKSGPPTQSFSKSTSGSPRQDYVYPSYPQQTDQPYYFNDEAQIPVGGTNDNQHQPVVEKVPKRNKKAAKKRRSKKKPAHSDELPTYDPLVQHSIDSIQYNNVNPHHNSPGVASGGVIAPIEGGFNGIGPVTYIPSPRPPVPISDGSLTAVNAGRPIVSPISGGTPPSYSSVSPAVATSPGSNSLARPSYNMMKSPLSPHMLEERVHKAAMLGYVPLITDEDTRPSSSSSSLLRRDKERGVNSHDFDADNVPYVVSEPHNVPYQMPRKKKETTKKLKKTLSISDHVEVFNSPKVHSPVIQDQQLYSSPLPTKSPKKATQNSTCCGPPASPVGTVMIPVSSSESDSPMTSPNKGSSPLTPFNYKSQGDVRQMKKQYTGSSSPRTPVYYASDLDKVRRRQREAQEKANKLAEKEARRKQRKRQHACGGFCGFCKEDSRVIRDIPARRSRRVRCKNFCCAASFDKSYGRHSLISSESTLDTRQKKKSNRCRCSGCCSPDSKGKKKLSSSSGMLHNDLSPISELTTRLELH